MYYQAVFSFEEALDDQFTIKIHHSLFKKMAVVKAGDKSIKFDGCEFVFELFQTAGGKMFFYCEARSSRKMIEKIIRTRKEAKKLKNTIFL